MECLDIDMLCRHLDDDLDAQMQTRVVEHLNTCQSCADRLQRLREHDAILRTLPNTSSVAAEKTMACCKAEDLSAYVSDTLPATEAQRIEQHLGTCDACLSEVMGMHRTRQLLTRDALATPPAHLVATVQQGFVEPQPATMVERLGTLIVQVAADGLTFIQALLVPEHVGLTIGGHSLPATAFRGSQTASDALDLLDMQQTVHDVTLHIHVLHEERETVLLHLVIQKADASLGGRRVVLSSQGRMVSAKTTSADGGVEFPRLTSGDYTLNIPQEQIETRLILRGASEAS
jgi:anti-sigma factor RsiW